MRALSIVAAVPALIGLAAGPTLAADAYKIDREHVWVAFEIEHLPWAEYLGMFHSIDGQIQFDQNDVSASSVHAEIATASVDTSNASRDQGELQGYGFFNSGKFPQITFDSTSIEKTGDRSGKITGNLTIGGVSKPVVLDTVFNGQAVSPWDGAMRIGFSATGTLDTNDFGMTGVVPLKIGPKVDFHIEVEAVKCELTC